MIGRHDAHFKSWIAGAEEEETLAKRARGGRWPPEALTLNAAIRELIEDVIESG